MPPHRPHAEVRERENARDSKDRMQRTYLMACGLIGEPVPPEMINGGPVKKNS
jgi:hypothetical protein